jgi:hypothetical protein
MLQLGCNKSTDEEKPTDKHILLYDKWWYNINNQGMGDHFFNSDGTIVITNPPSLGTYVWIENDSMTISIQNLQPYNIWFSKIEDTLMEFRHADEPEGNYYQFSTVKP